MDLTKVRELPFEISLAQPDSHGLILNRNIYEQLPLKLSLLHGYYAKEILSVTEPNDYPEDFRAELKQALAKDQDRVSPNSDANVEAAEEEAPKTWCLWKVLINPCYLKFSFYRRWDEYDPASNGLAIFQANDDALSAALEPKRIVRDRISLTVTNLMAVGLSIYQPSSEITTDLEISSSGPDGTHNLRITLRSGDQIFATVALSLPPETRNERC